MPSTSVVIIREQSGRGREVDLIGAALPFMGASWGGAMVMNTNWNPGNPNATQQVLVPTEMPSAWEGSWNTNRLVSTPPTFSEGGGAPQPIVLADTLRDILEAIFRSGQTLSVVWIAGDNRRVSRFGRAKSWNFQHRGADDIKWSITFEWSGRSQTAPTISPDQGILASVRASAQASADAASYSEAQRIISANAQRPRSASRFTLGQLEQLAGAPQALMASFTRLSTAVTNRLRHVTDILVKTRDQPAAVFGLAVSAATDAVSTANDFLDRMSRPGPEQMSNEVRVASLLRATRYYSGGMTQAQLMASESARLRRQAMIRQAGARPAAGDPSTMAPVDAIQVWLPRQGETMTSIALRFYKQDLSFELARANGLPGSTITPPRRALIIPQLSVLQRLQQR